MSAMPSRVALWCWYHGGGFRGYQSQQVGPTVQDTVITALRAAGFSRNPVVCSRTDLGVHARMQVLSLRVVEGGRAEEMAGRLNAVLPATVGIACSRLAPPKFHAAWSSVGKEYRYRLLLADDPEWDPSSWRVSLDPALLELALARVVGTRDFSIFHDSSSTVRPRTITHAAAVARGARLEIRLRGDAFGRYMVRQLVGGMVDVATGACSLDRFTAALEGQRTCRPTRAPARGLVLWEICYPSEADPFASVRPCPGGLPQVPPFCD
jgi:tRNA pseudouridine38-40 synthase